MREPGRIARGRCTVAARALAGGLLALSAAACTHEVVVKPPERIVIDMNVKIDHRVRVEVEKDLEREMEKREDVF